MIQVIMLIMLSYFMSLVFILIGIAFFTLCERKLLGYFHLRKGPNKVGYIGLLQPFADAGKLFTKERLMLLLTNKFCYFLAPLLLLFLAIFMWCLYPIAHTWVFVEYSIFFFLCVSGIGVYGTIMCGWGSNSKYALLGRVRAVAQTVSYEVRFSFILLSPILIGKRLMFSNVLINQTLIFNLFLFMGGFCMWFITILAETNRAPFDFVEGESELVRGFNVEYGGYGFALIFIAEYLNIMFISVITVCLFLGVFIYAFIPAVVFICYSFVWVRATFPRYRYDLLISITWKCLLPVRLSAVMFFVGWLRIIA